jgi:glycosyltransferase involved in cell wall biosynthesis
MRQIASMFLDETKDITSELHYPNVIHSTSFHFVKNHSTANVYTIYDLSFFEHPDTSTYANRQACMTGMLEASLRADMFIAISEYSKKVFLKYFPYVSEDRVRVIPLSYRKALLEPVNVKVNFDSLGIDSEKPFWFCVGTIEPRKNIVSLVRAYLKLRSQGETYPLYLAGKKGWLDEEILNEINASRAGDDIRLLGFVNESQLSALYRSCFAMVYPSLYEGFGLPILEAMSLGAPVITSNTTSMPEVGGDAVIYVDPRNVDDIYEKMKLLQQNEELRKTIGEKGRERALNEFSWEKTATKTIQCYYEAVWRHRTRLEEAQTVALRGCQQ